MNTFGDLREKKTKMEEDMKNRCFICHLERYVFDKNAKSFDIHIERDHNLWNYLYYIYHIKTTDKTEFNGIESYVFEKL